jgi:hypothetical protein
MTTPFEMFRNETLRDFESLRSADADSVRHGSVIDGVACPAIVSAFAVRLIQSRDGVTSIEVEMHHNRIRTQKNTKIHERKKKKKLKNEQPGTPTAVRELVDQRQSEQRDDGANCVVKDDSFRPLLQSNEINPAVLSARSERILWLFHLSRPPKKLRALLLSNDFVTDRPTDSRTNEIK